MTTFYTYPEPTLVCVHGDERSAVVMAANLRRTLEEKGAQIVTLPEMREWF